VAGIINNILLNFNEQGADKTVAATENVNKATTRLGNTSAANGRQFAAQSQGLGGLVAAYAGAAATSFALQQAFAALQKAASFDQIIQGTGTFSSQFGQSADAVIGNIKRITQGQLSIVEAATAANLALSAGFNTKQLNELADVATKSARALGRDLSDSFDRLVKGSAKLEPELLDELGIFTRIEPAVEKYAASLNRSVSSLTEFERRQAFVNSVIAEGQSKFSIIDSSNATASQSYSKLAATLTDLALKIGNVIANALAPLADYISGNIATAFGAFGIIITLVLGKLNELTLVGLTNANKKITEVSNSLSTNFIGSGKKSAEVLQELAVATGNFDIRLKKGLGTNADARDNLIGLASAGKASVNQLKELNTILEANNKEQTKSIEIANRRLANNVAGTNAFKNNTADLDRATRSQAQNTAQIEANSKVIDAQNRFANAGAVAVSGFGKGLSLIGSFASGLLKTFNLVLLGISLFGLLGPKILEAFGVKGVVDKFIEGIGSIINNFLGLDKVSLQTKKGIDGVAAAVTAASFEAEKLKGNLEGEVKIPTFFGTASIKINAETIQKDIADAISGGFKAGKKIQADFQNDIDRRKDALGTAQLIAKKVTRGREVPGLDAGKAELAILEAQNNSEDMKIKKRKAFQDSIQAGIDKARESLNIGQDANTTNLLVAQIVALEKIKNLNQQQVEIGGYISAVTGLSAKKVAESVKINEDGLAVIKGTSGELSVQLKTLEEIEKLTGPQLIAATATNEINAKLVAFTSNIVTDTEKLKKGQLDLNGLGKARADQLAFETSLREEITKLQENATGEALEELKILNEILDRKKQEREIFLSQSATQEAVLKIQDQTRKSFSSQIDSLNQINGLISLNGELAKTSLEVDANKLDTLEAQIAAGEAAQKRVDAIKQSRPKYEAEGDDAAILRLAETAKKAIGGSIGEVFKKTYELTLEYRKQTDELQKQAIATRSGIERERLNNAIQLTEKLKEYNTLVIQNQLNAIERQKTLNNLSAERIDILRKGREDESKSQMSGVLAPLFTDKAKRDIEIKFKEDELNDLKRALGAQVASAADTLQKEKELATENYAREIEKLNFQKALSDLDKKTKEDELTVRKKEFDQNVALTKTNFDAISRQIVVFTKHPEELSKVFNDFLNNYSKLLTVTTPDKAKEISDLTVERQVREKQLEDSVKSQLEKSKEGLTNTYKGLTTAQDALRTSLNELGSSYEENQKIVEKIDRQTRDVAKLRMDEANTAATAKYNDVVAETGNKLLAATQALEILKREAERAGDSFTIVAVKTAESIGSNLEKGVNSLVDAVANGTLTLESFQQGFKQFILSILTDISKAILNELITKPLKESVMSFTRDLIGGLSGSGVADIGKKLAESVGPAVSGQLTQSFADLPKAIAGFKDIGVTPVIIVGVAPGAMAGLGNLGGLGGAGGIGSALTGGAGGAGNVAVPGSTEAILATLRKQESGSYAGNYLAQSKTSSASGAYQYIDDTWKTQAAKAGVDTNLYPRAFMAPSGVQDMVARQNVESITQQYGAGAVPNVWFTGRPSGMGNRAASPAQVADYNQKFNANAAGIQAPLPPPRPADLDTSVKDKLDGVGESAEKFGTNLDKSGEGLVELGQKATESGAGADALAQANEGGAAAAQAKAAADQGGAAASQASAASSGTEAAASATNAAAKGTEAAASATVTAAKQTEATASQAGGGIGGMISNLFSGIGNIFGSIFSSIGSGFGSLFKGIFSIFGFSSGGSVGSSGALMHLARGGFIPNYGAMQHLASGGLRMRDSVPALLEPGEFVMKKTSVDSIGRSSMERMNATGKSSGGATNIKVQVDNSGQPKEAQQGETQFDGETAIVKLILKDLNSNGPIRRSIRGNT
jgi:hypothetical protein